MPDHTIAAIIISITLVIITSVIFYEILCFILRLVAKYDFKPRRLMLVLVLSIFAGHTFSVWLYGVVYWMLAHYFGFPALTGDYQEHFFAYIYFSAATYSSLGIGDVFPHGALRFIAGVEVLNGLMLIGWSVTFTYFAVQQLWETHGIKLTPKLFCQKDNESC